MVVNFVKPPLPPGARSIEDFLYKSFNDWLAVQSVFTFSEMEMPGGDRGLALFMKSGSKFHVTITKADK